MARNIISFYALFMDGFTFGFDNNNGDLLVYKDGCYYFKASPHNGVYESVVCLRNNNLTCDRTCPFHVFSVFPDLHVFSRFAHFGRF